MLKRILHFVFLIAMLSELFDPSAPFIRDPVGQAKADTPKAALIITVHNDTLSFDNDFGSDNHDHFLSISHFHWPMLLTMVEVKHFSGNRQSSIFIDARLFAIQIDSYKERPPATLPA